MIMPIFAVRDVDVSIAYYRDRLGFAVSMHLPGENGKTTFAAVALGPTARLGLSAQPDVPHRGEGIVQMIFVPDATDIDDYYESCRAAGAEIVREIADELWGDRTFLLRDPDGFVLQFAKTVQIMDSDEIAAAMGSGAAG